MFEDPNSGGATSDPPVGTGGGATSDPPVGTGGGAKTIPTDADVSGFQDPTASDPSDITADDTSASDPPVGTGGGV